MIIPPNLIPTGVKAVTNLFKKDRNRDPILGGDRFVQIADTAGKALDVAGSVADKIKQIPGYDAATRAYTPLLLGTNAVQTARDIKQSIPQQNPTPVKQATFVLPDGSRVAAPVDSPQAPAPGGQDQGFYGQDFQGDVINPQYQPQGQTGQGASATSIDPNTPYAELIDAAARAGLSVTDFLSLYGAQNAPTQQDYEGIRSELGIPDLVDDVFRRPSLDAQAIFDNAFKEARLPELREKITQIDAEIQKARDQLKEAIGQENNNPFISAQSRSLRIRNIQDQAEATIANLENQRGSLADLYNTGLDQVEGVVTRATSTDENTRIRSAEQLNFLLQEAERRFGALGAESEREALRYVPDFLKRSIEESQNQPMTAEEILKLENQRLTNEKLRAEIDGTGRASFGDTSSLRKEFLARPEIKNWQEIDRSYSAMQEAYTLAENGDNGPARDALIVLFNKMLDPGSVVREGEFARTAEGQSVIQQAFESSKRLVQAGAGIDTATLKQALGVAEALYQAGQQSYFEVANEYVDLANQFGIDPRNVIGSRAALYDDDIQDPLLNDLSTSLNGSNQIGELSERYESKGDPGAIGYDSTGGYSYGVYQLAHSNAKDYVEQSPFGQLFAGLRFNSPEFRQRWQEVASQYGDEFAQDQKQYIQRTHFQPQVEKIKSAGFDFSKATPALLDVVWSTAVQHGPQTDIVVKAIKKAGPNATEEELIKEIYAQRWAGGQGFASSTPEVKKSVYNRFFGEGGEQALALNKSRSFNRRTA